MCLLQCIQLDDAINVFLIIFSYLLTNVGKSRSLLDAARKKKKHLKHGKQTKKKPWKQNTHQENVLCWEAKIKLPAADRTIDLAARRDI